MDEKIIKELGNAFAEFKAANEERLTSIEKNQGVAELESKIQKSLKPIEDAMEKAQKEKLELEKQITELQSKSNSPINGGEDVEKKRKEDLSAKAFKEFLKVDDKVNFKTYVNSHAEYKELSVDSDVDGGYLVTPTRLTGILQNRMFETSPMRQVATTLSITGDRLEIPFDDTEASAGWVGERGSHTETNTPQIGLLDIPLHGVYAQPSLTSKMIAMSGFDAEGYIVGKSQSKISRQENSAFITGNGSAKPRGILTYDAWSVAGTYQRDAIEQINSGSGSTFTADGLIMIQNGLLDMYQANAKWMIKRSSFAEIAKLKDGQGQYLFNMQLDKNVGNAFDLLTKPVVFADDMDAVGSNALSLAYGDFREGYTIVDNSVLDIIRDPYTNKGKIIIDITKYVGGAVTNFEAIKLQKIAA